MMFVPKCFKTHSLNSMYNNPLGIVIVNDGFQPLHGVQPDLFGELNEFVSEEYCVYHFIRSYVFYFSKPSNSLRGFLEKFFVKSDVEMVLNCFSFKLNLDNFSHIDVYKPVLMFSIACVIADCYSGVPINSKVFDTAYSMFFKSRFEF